MNAPIVKLTEDTQKNFQESLDFEDPPEVPKS